MKFDVTVVQGSVHVNSIDTLQVSDTAILLYADAKQKRPVIEGYSKGPGIAVYVGVDGVLEGKNNTEIQITGLEPSEWECIADAGRYTVLIALVRKSNPVQIWRDE